MIADYFIEERYQDEVYAEATKFILKYKNYARAFPLYATAVMHDPTVNRELGGYTDFAVLTRDVQNQVLSMTGSHFYIPPTRFNIDRHVFFGHLVNEMDRQFSKRYPNDKTDLLYNDGEVMKRVRYSERADFDLFQEVLNFVKTIIDSETPVQDFAEHYNLNAMDKWKAADYVFAFMGSMAIMFAHRDGEDKQKIYGDPSVFEHSSSMMYNRRDGTMSAEETDVFFYVLFTIYTDIVLPT